MARISPGAPHQSKDPKLKAYRGALSLVKMLDKLAKVFGKKTFKGQGHRLGTSEESNVSSNLYTCGRSGTLVGHVF